MNTVNSRQNIDIALECQTSARYYYDRADLLDNIYWFGILTTIILKFIWINNIWIDYALILWFFITLLLDTYISTYTSSASQFKQIFDEYVFGWKENFSNETIQKINILKSKNKSMFDKQMSHTGNDNFRGVKDWYEFVDDEDNQNEAIQKSIRESVYYDNSINQTLLIILVILTVFTLIYFRNTTLTIYLKTIFLVLSNLSKKVVTTLLKSLRVNRLNKEINIRLDLAKTNDDFKEIQNIIFMKRQISGVTPNWIYYIRKNKITKLASYLFP
ncbi:S-4TM family putative pore-forming effector [Enterococcus alcedinis]|uniref:Uncharacterized protein n=1 Tax=Enterococcus alcedinis TaxID=1274384 RepID=A0A917N4N4_9ENTE|nr:S-4TM family putative pore-forming effector [Enterococcus alcedinis]MBP2102038.1 hypothetical protein [Enterococcus alcedinis]GGI65601.1 hypothetical protein GCM10011482_12550 [Enterococcus alcedinis]